MVQQVQNLLFGDAKDFQAFGASVFSALNSNSRLWRFQNIGEKFDQRFVGAVFGCGSLQTNFEGTTPDAGDFVFAGARLNAYGEDDGSGGGVLGNFWKGHVAGLRDAESIVRGRCSDGEKRDTPQPSGAGDVSEERSCKWRFWRCINPRELRAKDV